MMQLLFLLPLAFAHRPTFGPGFGSLPNAYPVEDPEVSIVVYSPLTCQESQVWLSLDAEPGFPLYLQLGVPQIERLTEWRPTLALLAPGLPDATELLPFEVPDGLGVTLFQTESVTDPGSFFEPFSGTSSWVLAEATVTLPQGGPAYVVAWDPGGYSGKLWVATGTIEDFANVDPSNFVTWMEQVNNFHETGRYEDTPEVEEVDCLAPPADLADSSGGCQTGPGYGSFGLVTLIWLFGCRTAVRKVRVD